jgi:hypothetical protein
MEDKENRYFTFTKNKWQWNILPTFSWDWPRKLCLAGNRYNKHNFKYVIQKLQIVN